MLSGAGFSELADDPLLGAGDPRFGYAKLAGNRHLWPAVEDELDELPLAEIELGDRGVENPDLGL